MKATVIAAALAFAAATSMAYAGVTPNAAASAASQSGAKIAPAKNNAQSQNSGETAGEASTAK